REAGRDARVSASREVREGVEAGGVGRRRPAPQGDGGAADGAAAGTRRHVALHTAAADGRALRQTERPYARVVVEAVDGVVHVRVPERAAVGVERHRAVIAPTDARRPAAVSYLRARPLDEHLLGLAEGIDGVGGEPARVLDGGLRGAARRAVAARHVPRAV